MTAGSPARSIAAFSLPLLLGNVFQQLYNMVDSMVVGKFVGSAALAAVGTGFPLIFLLTSVFLGFGMGATVLIAQFVGAGERDQVARTVDTVYTALLAICVPLTLIGVLGAGPLLRLIRVEDAYFNQARLYVTVVFAGILGNLGYNLNAGVMQGLGDSRTPLLLLCIASVINIVLDLVFVLVFHWQVFGVAIATVIAQFCSWIFGKFYINRKYGFLHLKFFQFKLDRRLLNQVVRLGVPAAVQQCQFSIGILFFQALVNGYGEEFTAGFGAANKIDTFAFMPIESFGVAATTYVGQNMGAGDLDRVSRGVRASVAMSLGVCVVMSLSVMLLRVPLLTLFTDDPAVIAAGEAYLLRVVGPMPVLAVTFTLNAVLRGAGDMLSSTVANVVGLWIARIPVAFLIAAFFPKEEIYWSYLIGWVIGGLVTVPAYCSGRWKSKCLVRG